MLVPLIWMVILSLETKPEASSFPPVLLPTGLHFGNYPATWKAVPFGHFFINSALVFAGHRGRKPRVLQPGRIRVRADQVLRSRRVVRRAAGDADGALPGPADPNVPDRQEARHGRQRRRADHAQPVQRVRDLHAAPVLPHAADRARGGRPDRRHLTARDPDQDRPAAVDAGAGHAGDHPVPVVLERLPVAADHHRHRQPRAPATRPLDAPGRSQHRVEPADGRHRDEPDPDAGVFLFAQRWFIRSIAFTGIK